MWKTCLPLLLLVGGIVLSGPKTSFATSTSPVGESDEGRRLTLDLLYHPENKLDFDGDPPVDLQWLADGEHYLHLQGGAPRRVHARTGRSTPLLTRQALEGAFRSLPDFSPRRARQAVQEASFDLSPDESSALVTFEGDLFLYDLNRNRMRRLTRGDAPAELPDFSPDGRKVAFVRDNDLYVVEVSDGRERRLTQDGSPDVLNGKLDWVYQEELYGRGNFKGFWWSPDGTRIAYLQLDQSEVPRFSVVDHVPLHLELETTPYPKAGDPNPEVRLGVVESSGGNRRWVDTSEYGEEEILIVRVGWTPGGGQLVYQVQNREQTWLDLNVAGREVHERRTLLRETTPAWVNVLEEPRWLTDGSFLWLSERSGWRRLYRIGPDGSDRRELTSGEWDVREILAVNETGGWVYFSGTERSARDLDLYRIRLDGSALRRISREPGTWSASFNSGAGLFIARRSDVKTPTQVSLHEADGTRIRFIDRNPASLLEEFSLSDPEFVQVPARDGFPLEATLIRPPDFDLSRSYPVLVYVYAGPYVSLTRNRWGSTTYLWHQMLAQEGYVVWIFDNRSASGKGARSTWPVHRNFGELELRDIEDGIDWLKAQSWVDPGRIGIWGWSFGGYMTLYALTRSRSFRVGIAGAPVTDWRLYDTIYTERYMGTPQNNPEGYDRSSILTRAGDLHGRLLLIHPTMDDNVHLQQTIRLIHELQTAGRQFDLMLYPRSRHGVRDPWQLKHLRRLMTDFIRSRL